MNDIVTKQTGQLADRFAALRAKTTTQSIVWKPEPNEQLIGEIIGHQKATGAFGLQPQMLVRTEEGDVIAVWLNQWLLTALQNQGAEEGDLLALTFNGTKESPRGSKYHSYSLVIDKV